LSKFSGPALILSDVSEVSRYEREQLAAFSQHGGRIFVTGTDATELPESPNISRSPASPGAEHFMRLEKDFMRASQGLEMGALAELPEDGELRVEASPFVVSYAGKVDGKLHVFLSNFSGIIPHRQVKPTPATSARIVVAAGPAATLSFLPFLGTEQTLSGERSGDKMVFHLPALDRGAVVWLNDSN